MVLDTNPALQSLAKLVRAEGLASLHFTANMLNGFFLPDAIVMRLAL